MTSDQHDNTSALTREHLLTGAFESPIIRIEAHRVILRPGQKAGRHFHPGGVMGYVLDGEIAFEIAGQPATLLRCDSAFYEPPGVTILQFDNTSDTATATFVAFYPLTGDQPLISWLED